MSDLLQVGDHIEADLCYGGGYGDTEDSSSIYRGGRWYRVRGVIEPQNPPEVERELYEDGVRLYPHVYGRHGSFEAYQAWHREHGSYAVRWLDGPAQGLRYTIQARYRNCMFPIRDVQVVGR